jgi:hypothetical protein
MSKQLVESLRGVGKIFAGDVLLRTVPYELSLWSDPEGGATELPPSTSIDGHIDIAGIAEATVLAGPDSLTLELEDGRRMKFKLTNTGGAIEGRGPLSSGQ